MDPQLLNVVVTYGWPGVAIVVLWLIVKGSQKAFEVVGALLTKVVDRIVKAFDELTASNKEISTTLVTIEANNQLRHQDVVSRLPVRRDRKPSESNGTGESLDEEGRH